MLEVYTVFLSPHHTYYMFRVHHTIFVNKQADIYYYEFYIKLSVCSYFGFPASRSSTVGTNIYMTEINRVQKLCYTYLSVQPTPTEMPDKYNSCYI